MIASGSVNEDELPSHEVHWIKPLGPTRLDGCSSMPLPGVDQIFYGIDSVVILPGPIDVDRLKNAIALALAAYPHAAGRLRRGAHGRWRFELKKSAIPLTVTTSDLIVTDDMMHEPHPDLVNLVPCSPADPEGQPLVRFKVVRLRATGDTSISLHVSHTLGDGVAISSFSCTVSDYYTGRIPRCPLPTFDKYFAPPPPLDAATYARTLPLVPNLARDYTPEEYGRMSQAVDAVTARIDLYFTAAQLQSLRVRAQGEARTRLSRGDALVAYLFTVFNRVYPVKFNQLMNVVQVRGLKDLSDGDDYHLPSISDSGNVLFHSVSPTVPDDQLSLGGLAVAVRNTLQGARNVADMKRCMALCEQRYSEMARKGTMPWMYPPPRALGINLLHKSGIQDVHFGYPGKSRFYTYNSLDRYLRVFPQNPVRHADGSWTLNEGGVHVFFRVRTELRDDFMRTIEEDARTCVLVQAHAEAVSARL